MTDPLIPVEVEAKLLVPTTSDLRAIARLTQLGPHPLQPRGAMRLYSIYLDTPSLTLARNGVALRLRRQGRHWEATAKWAGYVEGDVHNRPELTVALPRAPELPFLPPPGPLQTQLAALVAGRPLTPILVSEIHRRLFDVLPSDPATAPKPIAELALDRVRLRTPNKEPLGGDQGAVAPAGHTNLPKPQPEATYCEVEIEQRHGKQRDVADLAEWLRRSFNLAPSHESKFARGLALLYGHGFVGSGTAPVLAYDTVHQGLRHIVARHLQQLRAHDPGARAGEDPEALHDMRVATRRLRAAVRLFAAAMPARSQSALSQELQWLGQLLGQVRDLDVQLAKLDRFITAAPAGFRPPLGYLRAHLDGERTERRSDMLAGLSGARYFRLLIRLERFAFGRTQPRDAAAREPIAVAGRRAIKQAFRRLRKCGERIEAMPRPEDLHALRIRAKRLRYLLEFLAELTGKPGRRLVRRLTALQDLLGSYHDAVVGADVIRVYVEGAGAPIAPAQMVALGALVASEMRLAEQNRADFESTWQRFARPRTTADCHAVLDKLHDLHDAHDLQTGTQP